MKLGRMNHLGYAVPDMDAAIAHYRDVMGASVVTEPFDMPEQGVKVCFVHTPGEQGTEGTQVELLSPLDENSPVAGFIAKNPLGGQLDEARAYFEGIGKRILGPTRIGAHGTPIFFVHPKDMMGMLTEIMETPKEAH